MVPTLVTEHPRGPLSLSLSGLDLQRLMIVLLVGLNLFDAYFTWHWVSQGLATEANPLMESTLNWGVEWFVGIKLFLVTGGCYILWRRAGAHAQRYVVPLFALYAGVVLFHLSKTISGV